MLSHTPWIRTIIRIQDYSKEKTLYGNLPLTHFRYCSKVLCILRDHVCMSIVCYVISCVTALAQVLIAQVAELEFYGRTLLRCCLKTTFLQLLICHCTSDYLGVPSCPPICLLAGYQPYLCENVRIRRIPPVEGIPCGEFGFHQSIHD